MFFLFQVLWLFVGVGLLGLGLRYKTYQKKLGRGVSRVFVRMVAFKYIVKCVYDSLGVLIVAEEIFVTKYSEKLMHKRKCKYLIYKFMSNWKVWVFGDL